MEWELLLWVFSCAGVIGLFGMSAYQLICLSDLEADYINPYDSSSRINAIVLPEFALQGGLCALFLLTRHWFPFLIMAPIAYYHVKLYMTKRHLIDVTEVFRVINREQKYRIVKLAFYFSLFLIIIYRLVMSAVTLLLDQEDGFLDPGF